MKLLAVIFFLIAPPIHLNDEHFMQRLNTNILLRTEIPRSRINVLDIGTGNGIFLLRIKDVFENMGYKVDVTGIDNGAILDGINESEEYRRRFVEALGVRAAGVRVLYGDINKPRTVFGKKKFDAVFINAPQAHEGNWQLILLNSLQVLRNDGLLVLRFHALEDSWVIINQVKDLVETMNYHLVETESVRLPEGDYPLSDTHFIIKKEPFKSDPQTLGQSLGRLVDEIYNIQELKKYA